MKNSQVQEEPVAPHSFTRFAEGRDRTPCSTTVRLGCAANAIASRIAVGHGDGHGVGVRAPVPVPPAAFAPQRFHARSKVGLQLVSAVAPRPMAIMSDKKRGDILSPLLSTLSAKWEGATLFN